MTTLAIQTKTWTKTEIEAMLNQNDQAILRAIVAIFNKQTEMEKISVDTIQKNGMGFSGADGKVGTFHGKYLVKNGMNTEYAKVSILSYWKRVSDKTGKMKIARYAGQLTKIANKEI